MPELISPNKIPLDGERVVFLAGSIEMGRARNWQEEMTVVITRANPDIVVANPRRSQWDSSWEQTIDNPDFREQVEWELDHIERADMVVFYFQPGTQSPVTLLELGKHLERSNARHLTLVCCPDGFWRKGNVEIACVRKGLPRPLASLDMLAERLTDWAMR